MTQREFKFRLWCAEYQGGKMKHEDFDIAYSRKNKGYYWVDLNGEHYADAVMQFTGLRDKNGKEIYEGDIIYRQWAIMHRGILTSMSIVEWNSEKNRYDGLEIDFNKSLDAYIKCEVIGNIYQNPELIISPK